MKTYLTTYWKPVAGVLLVFILGWLAGVLCASILFGHRVTDILKRGPEAVAEIVEKRMAHNLALDEKQKGQVHELVVHYLQQRRDLEKQVQPQIQALNAQTYQDINAILRPDQQEKLRKNIEAMRERFGKSIMAVDGEVPGPAGHP